MVLEKTAVTGKPLTLISKDCYWIYLPQMFVIWGMVIISKKCDIPFTLFFILTALLAIGLPVLLAETVRRMRKK